MTYLNSILFCLRAIKIIPQIMILLALPRDHIFNDDLRNWAKISDGIECDSKSSLAWSFVRYFIQMDEFRNLFYYRIRYARLFSLLARPKNTLYISTLGIGPGLFIQHGFATIIMAKSIGRNCRINQQVTIGYTDKTSAPVIGNGVTISAGAKVLGNITIGDNVTIGANAVVVRNVPSNCTVVGVPAYIIRKNGISVRERLS
jgi:serine O-acetyltransferase